MNALERRIEELLAAGLELCRLLAPRPTKQRPRGRDARPRRFWTAADREELRRRYPHESTKAVALSMGRTVSSLRGAAAELGLHKTEEYLASPWACRLRRGPNPGIPFRFKPGHVPQNKGLRRPGWHVGRMRETQFKKGHKPKTWVPVGTEVLDPGGYRKVKVSDDRTRASRFNWRFVHVLMWQQKHGPVPRGFAVAFRNGRKSDLHLDNLELVSRAEMMRRNSVHNLPKPLAEVIQLRGALVRQIRRRAS